MLVALQNRILELPQIRAFIRSTSYYPIGGEDYVKQVRNVSTILYCIVLYCIVLYCIVLYCIVLYCIVLYYGVLFVFYLRMKAYCFQL